MDIYDKVQSIRMAFKTAYENNRTLKISRASKRPITIKGEDIERYSYSFEPHLMAIHIHKDFICGHMIPINDIVNVSVKKEKNVIIFRLSGRQRLPKYRSS